MKTMGNAVGAGLIMTVAIMTATAQAEKSKIPADMVYVGQGPSIMGLDKAQPADSGRRLTLYDKRMKTPLSAEAFNDEGPAHTVFLDSYLIDKYEVSNKDYGAFIKATGHPAPAYWDDPRLNKPQQPVVGVNWIDAKTYCEYREKRLPTEAEWEKAAAARTATSIPGATTSIPTRQIMTGIMMRPCRWILIRRAPATTACTTWRAMSSNGSATGMTRKYYGRLGTMVNPTGPEKPLVDRWFRNLRRPLDRR
jgi:iron(II)-dependent oxidoreductase